ncbi:uncharacterized protein LOC62_02G003316 [Vanrija pseudolonga]|uniref:Uncharacterized protein n=1 Tax=Vanrija pseudolonga TaxID=143232 RepID=A0AAF1BJF5_9TREE|nr:hypothetical protein LOC62_02G003316 [Vanrija pseudolonga]
MSNPFQPMASHYDHAYARLFDDEGDRPPPPQQPKSTSRRGRSHKGKGTAETEGEEKQETTEAEPARGEQPRRTPPKHTSRQPQLAAWTSVVKAILAKARAPDALLVMQHIFMTVDPLDPSSVLFCHWVLIAQDRRVDGRMQMPEA